MTEKDEKVVGLTPDAEAAVDAILAEIVGSDDELGEDPAGEEEEETTDSTEYAEADDAEDDEEAEETEVGGYTKDEEKILRQWKLAKLPEAAFEALNSEERADWAANHAKVSSDVNRAFRERADLERRLQELEATKEAEHGVPTADVDLGEEQKKLADLYGDDEAEVLLGVAKRIAEAQVAPLRQELEAASQRAEADRLRETLRADLGTSDPRLRDPETFARVEETAGGLAATNRHADLEPGARAKALLMDAATLELGPLETDEADGEELTATPKRTPTRPKRRPKAKEPVTFDDKLDAKLKLILQGANAETIVRKLGR